MRCRSGKARWRTKKKDGANGRSRQARKPRGGSCPTCYECAKLSSRLGVIAVARGNTLWRADSGTAEASLRDQLVWATRSNGLHCETIYRFQILRLILGIALRSHKQFKMRRDQLLPDFGHICSIRRCAAVTVFQVNFRYVPAVGFTGGDF